MASPRFFALNISARRLRQSKIYSLFSIVSLAIALSFVGFSLSWLWVVASTNVNWPDSDHLYAIQFQNESVARTSSSAHNNSLRHVLDFLKQSSVNTPVAMAKKNRTELSTTSLSLAEKTETSGFYLYSQDLPKLLDIHPYQGRLPKPGGDEVLISKVFAERHFVQAEKALEQLLYTKNQTWKIVGILPENFNVPEPISGHRRGEQVADIFLPSDFSIEQLSLENRESFDNITLLLRSSDGRDKVELYVQEFLRTHAKNADMQINVYSMYDFVIGNEAKTAWMIFFAALALAFTAFIGIGMSNIARYVSRANEFYVRQALGANTHAGQQMERYELAIIVFFAVSLALLLSTSLNLLIRAHLPLDLVSQLSWRAPLAILALGIISFGMLGLILKLSLSTNFTHAGSTRSSLSPWMLRSLRVMLAIQILLAMGIISAINTSLDGNWKVFKASSGRELNDLYWLGLQFQSDNSISEIQADLLTLKNVVIGQTKATEAAIAFTDSPIRLMGTTEGYIGQEPDRKIKIIQENPDGSWVQESSESTLKAKSGENSYHYAVSIIGAEPHFASMLGLKLIQGRNLKTDDQGIVLLTESAKQAIWGTSTPPGEEWLIPAVRNSKYHPPIWHQDLRAVGVVTNGRMTSADKMMILDTMLPTVFMSINALSVQRKFTSPIRAGILYRSSPDHALTENLALKLINQTKLHPTSLKTSSLAEEQRGYLIESIFSAMLAVSLNILVVLTLFLGAIGAIHFTCNAQKSEIGVRLAIGAPEGNVRILLFRREVLPHFVLLLLMSSATILISQLLLKGSLTIPVLIAFFIVSASLISGFLLAINNALKESAAQLLSQGE